MKMVYVMIVDNDFDGVRAFGNIDALVDAVHDEVFENDYIFLDKEMIKKHIEEREEQGCCYLFFPKEINSDYEYHNYSIQKIIIE